MDSDTRKLIRAVVRRVHPDLFTANPFERQRNSDSLKALNNYVEQVARGITPRSQNVEFWVKDGERLLKVDALLPSSGSLGPLFFAFGLITEEELQAGTGRADVTDTNFLDWLRQTVSEAVKMAEQHESLKQRIRELRANIEHKYTLASLQVGSEFAIGPLEQQRQVEALRVLDGVLASVATEDKVDFGGLNIHVYHPDACPLGSFGLNDAAYNGGSAASHVADDGCLHVVADRSKLRDALRKLDLQRARVLTKVTMFWLKRVRDLSPVLRDLLGVENVWCDSRTEQNSQNFVLWAGYILEQRSEVLSAVGSRRYTFSLLVHSDSSSPMIEFSQNSSILQVRSDCAPKQLVEFLCSDSGVQANQAAAAVQVSKKEEQALLEQIRKAFNAKHVVRVCSMYESERVLEGARRLLEAADVIRQTVDLSGASLAIDDCYEVWGSGFISIPYDFNLQELQPQLMRLLGAGRPDSPGGPAAAAASSSNGNSYSAAGAARRSSYSSNATGGSGSSSSSGAGGAGSLRQRWQDHQRQQQQPRSSLLPPGPQGMASGRSWGWQYYATAAAAAGVRLSAAGPGQHRARPAAAAAVARGAASTARSQQHLHRCAAVRLS